jgi:hypothetical protein
MNKDTKSGLGGKQDEAERDPLKLGQGHEAQIDQAIQKHIGRKLQATYNDLVNQPVPDKFRQLLDELEQQEKKQ